MEPVNCNCNWPNIRSQTRIICAWIIPVIMGVAVTRESKDMGIYSKRSRNASKYAVTVPADDEELDDLDEEPPAQLRPLRTGGSTE